MERVGRALLVCAVAFALPAMTDAQPCHTDRTTTHVAPAVQSLVARINARGLQHFARAENAVSSQEWSGSPAVDWYFNAIESGRGLTARFVGARRLIDDLTASGTDLSTLLWVNPRKSAFSAADAAILARRFCVRTIWSNSENSDRALAQWEKRHVPDLRYIMDPTDGSGAMELVGMRGGLPLRRSEYNNTLPFYFHDGVAGTSIGSSRAGTMLYLFWGSEKSLRAFQVSLDLSRWEHIRNAFQRHDLSLTNVRYQHGYEYSRRAAGKVLLGASATPEDPFQNGISGSGFLRFGSPNALFEVAEGVAARADDWDLHCLPLRSGERICPRMDWESYPLPSGKYHFSAAAPMLYAVVDRRTGVILLLGSHG